MLKGIITPNNWHAEFCLMSPILALKLARYHRPLHSRLRQASENVSVTHALLFLCRVTFASMRATVSDLQRSGKNWYSLSKALFASKSYVPEFTCTKSRACTDTSRSAFDIPHCLGHDISVGRLGQRHNFCSGRLHAQRSFQHTFTSTKVDTLPHAETMSGI